MEHSSRPTERIVSNIASKRSAEGFLVPLTYWANKLCDIEEIEIQQMKFTYIKK